MNNSPRFSIDCADHAGFIRIVNGQKTILTRANLFADPSRNYSQSKPGDILELIDNQSGKKVRAEVVSVQNFVSITELFNESNVAEESFNKKFKTEKELQAEYESNRKGYVALINANGLVAWRIKLLPK